MDNTRTCVLMVAAGAAWESPALTALSERQGIVVLKRCMDVTDALASATTGQAQVAVVSLDAPGLDGPAVEHLLSHGVRVVAVVAEPGREDVRDRLTRIGVRFVVGTGQLEVLGDAVAAAGTVQPSTQAPPSGPRMGPGRGRAIVVWGPGGAPGRTTVAIGLAGELAGRGAEPLVVDADPWGGTVAQHLGVLDEVSGLLASARASAAGELPGRFVSLQRRVAGVRLVSGLPRPERWVEVRPGVVEQLMEVGRREGDVVVDTGFALEEDPAAEYSGRASRNLMTLEAIGAADELVVVGAADPVGLSRLARGLADLREVTEGRTVRVVVNRMRGSLGWSEQDVAGMLRGFAEVSALHFLPYDRSATDRALLAGRTLAELGDTGLSRAIGQVVDGIRPGSARSRRGVRRRTAGTARRR